jgi:DNA-binding LacI/PurR family transcriptional regulator
VVCLDRLPDGLDVDSVCVDDRSAAGLAVSHLLAMGHRRIAVLTGPPSLRNEQERLRGYRLALQKAGVPVRESLIWVGGFDPGEVSRACQKGLLNPGDRPSALFTTNGVTGLEALRSIYSSGLSCTRRSKNRPRDAALAA